MTGRTELDWFCFVMKQLTIADNLNCCSIGAVGHVLYDLMDLLLESPVTLFTQLFPNLPL